MGAKVVIYGGTGGVGERISRSLSSKGVSTHMVARNRERLSALAGELGATFTVGDVHDTELFKRTMEDAGAPCCGLVYAVGTINTGSLRRLSASDYIDDFQVNALGAVLAAKAALPAMKKNKSQASMVFFSSVAAVQGFTFHSSIGMAKGAVNGLVLSLAAELAPQIRVNAIAPSITDTPLASAILKNEAQAARISNEHALKRIGVAEDVANLAVYMLGDESSWITGQVFSVDGGRSTLRPPGT